MVKYGDLTEEVAGSVGQVVRVWPGGWTVRCVPAYL